MKKIIFTFAGREKTMALQMQFMQRAIERKQVDEWHIWDFARQPNDRAWLYREFGDSKVILSDATSTNYIPILIKETNHATISVIANNDAHVFLMLDNGVCFEIVIGAFQNSMSLLRKFEHANAYKLNSPPLQTSKAFLNLDVENIIDVLLQDGKLNVNLNEVQLFAIPDTAAMIKKISVHTGYKSEGQWGSAFNKKIKLIKNTKAGYDGFKSVYTHYSANSYADCLFVKMDDDVIWCDLEQLDDFFQRIEMLKGADTVSANIINNGVCAYYQKLNGYFPNLNSMFEYPQNGYLGNLWASAERCEELHLYFIKNINSIQKIAREDRTEQLLPRQDRFSINFMGFKHALFLCMIAAYNSDEKSIDDERFMTQIEPTMFGTNKFIFNRLLVSHLSFYKQEENLNSDKIIYAYKSLLNN